MIWMNSRASLRPKPTTPRIRNYRRSWTSSATAFKLLWTATRYALSVTFTTTLTGSALVNLPYTDISSTVTSFTFTDGSGLTIDNSNFSSPTFHISTDASGNIVTWLIGACGSTCNIQMQTNLNSPVGFIPGADFSETTASFAGSYGFLSSDPGTWTMQTGAVMQPNSPANLSQQFVFNNVTDQHVEFDFDYTTAYNNSDLSVVSKTLPTVTNQGITHATYALMVANTSLATTSASPLLARERIVPAIACVPN